jgi:uncharacterized membrane protein YuzA (DUF378 family)
MEKGWLEWIALAFILIGGINWAFFSVGYDLIEMLLGTGPLAQTIYALIAVSTFYLAYFIIKD